MIQEFDNVVLTVDLPQFGLASGDIGTVVMLHASGKGYEVEFVTLDGETIAVTSLLATHKWNQLMGDPIYASTTDP